MATERTPQERAANRASEVEINAVIAQAVENYASWIVSDTTDLDPATCENWINTIWNTLREALTPEQRLRAILLLIHDRADARARDILSSLREVA